MCYRGDYALTLMKSQEDPYLVISHCPWIGFKNMAVLCALLRLNEESKISRPKSPQKAPKLGSDLKWWDPHPCSRQQGPRCSEGYVLLLVGQNQRVHQGCAGLHLFHSPTALQKLSTAACHAPILWHRMAFQDILPFSIWLLIVTVNHVLEVSGVFFFFSFHHAFIFF